MSTFKPRTFPGNNRPEGIRRNDYASSQITYAISFLIYRQRYNIIKTGVIEQLTAVTWAVMVLCFQPMTPHYPQNRHYSQFFEIQMNFPVDCCFFSCFQAYIIRTQVIIVSCNQLMLGFDKISLESKYVDKKRNLYSVESESSLFTVGILYILQNVFILRTTLCTFLIFKT